MKLYEKLLEVLHQHQVDHIFGVPGDAINPLIEALRHDEAIKYIHVSHEESGAFAASAAAKLTGGIGLLGSRGGGKAMAECDLLLMLGSDFPYKQWYSSDCDIVQVDNRAMAALIC